MKKLFKSNNNRIFSGLIGGIGEYFKIDPSLLRVIYLIIIIFTGFFPGIIVYIIASLIVPRKI